MRKGTHSGRHTFYINEERKKVRRDKTYVFLSSFTKENIALSADEDKKRVNQKAYVKASTCITSYFKKNCDISENVIFLKTFSVMKTTHSVQC